MSNKEVFKKEYDQLIDELTHILNSNEIVPELQNESVVLQLLKSIKISEYLEDKLEIPQSQRMSFGFLKTLSQYYAISNIHVDSYYYIDETTLNDDVNYLKIFSENILKKKYTDLTPRNGSQQANNKQSDNIHSTKLEKSNPNTENPNTNNDSGKPYDYLNGGNGNYSGFGNSWLGSLFGGGMYNPYSGDMGGNGFGSMEDQMAYQAANARFNSEFQSGKIYVYDSKPKIIPILKIVAGILASLLVVTILISTILSTEITRVPIKEGTPLYEYLQNNYSLEKYLQNYNSYYGTDITTPVFGLYGSSITGGGWLFAVIFCLIFIYEAYIQLKPVVSDNYKYKMRIGLLLIEVIIILVFYIFTFSAPTIPHFFFQNWHAFVETYKGTSYMPLMTAAFAFTIIYVVLLCLLVLIPLIAWIFKPKFDVDFVRNTIQQYYNEARDQISSNLGR